MLLHATAVDPAVVSFKREIGRDIEFGLTLHLIIILMCVIIIAGNKTGG